MEAKIKVKNGYWTYNGKPLVKCTFPERQIVSQFIKNSIFSIELDNQMEVRESNDLLEHNYNFEFVRP
jgi:hypothetical protein